MNQLAEPGAKQFGVSPDIGAYVIKDGRVYTEYGEVFEHNPLTHAFRAMLIPESAEHDFSEWTDEKRAEVKRKWDAVFAENKRQRESRETKMRRVAEEAERLLTKEQIEALRWAYLHE